ncbi:PEBP-like protein [Peniophora sp. CONT]|nr:PEBP-like protein [Peniophora sp. CONT]
MAKTGLGAPVAGTFFLCGGDDQVKHTSDSYAQAFQDNGLIPKPLGVFAPDAVLDLTYPSVVSNGSFLVYPGLNLTEEQVVAQPELLLTFESTGLSQDAADYFSSTFVLFALDPDAPTPQNTSLANFVHWVQPNLKVSGPVSTFAPLVNSTPALFEYISPGPPPTSDAHRYTFVLFEQPEGFEAAAIANIPADRTAFDLDAFATAVGLQAPVAGTFFRTGANVTFPSPNIVIPGVTN